MKPTLPLLLMVLFSPWFRPPAAPAEGPGAADPARPYRTDAADQNLPWYQLKPGEFPPIGSEHLVGGELVEADFIHRSGQFRTDATGELVDLTLPPFGSVLYLDAEADLRDVPLGVHFWFSLYQDAKGAFTRVAVMRDEFTLLAARGETYRLAEVKPEEGTLDAIRQNTSRNQTDLGRSVLRVDERTRVWKGERGAKLSDLAVGDELLVNLSSPSSDGRRRCTEIWVGSEARQRATGQQRKKHALSLKERGLPAWIDRVDGKKLTVTLLGRPADLRAMFKDEGIDPARWAAEHRRVAAAVADEALRTYNPPVDKEGSTVVEFEGAPTDRYGCGGVSWTIQPDLLLEGFRKGRVVRLFKEGWPIKDMPFGDSLYTEVPGATNDEEVPAQYPFRTDVVNESLPWYQLKPGAFPPVRSEHRIAGELVGIDAARRSGRFRADGTGELVDFTMPPFGSVLCLGAGAEAADLSPGTRYHFFLYQDERGAFTKAAVVTDDYTRLAREGITYRLEAAEAGTLLLAKQHAPVKSEKGEMVKPPDFGGGEFAADEKTRVWKGGKEAKLADLAAGDELLFNLTGRAATSRGRCTDIWAGADAQTLAAAQQRRKHGDYLKEHGLPAWVDRAEGKNLTITFFSGDREEFRTLLGDDPWGKSVYTTLADERLRPGDSPLVKMGFKNHLPEGDTGGTYGCSGVRWVLESDGPPEGYRQGAIIRVFKEGWPVKDPPGHAP